VTEDRNGQFAVHCILCGKNFYADSKIECGGMIGGKPMCKTNDIKKEFDKRIYGEVKGSV